jgi:hypothetical protein
VFARSFRGAGLCRWARECEGGLSARREYKVPWGYPCAGGVGGSGCKGVFLVAVDSTGEVFLGILGEVFDPKIVGGERGGMCDTCTRREPSTSVVVSDMGAAKVVKERGHLVIPWSAMIRLSKCEELTTVKPVK